ncbi:hypothetical protein Q9233_005581 [Columba guinea]|nr:hypothetical protein Q9233_005581 [Columba guinea]
MLCVSDCDDPKGVTLKPVDSGSASQKLRVTSKTMSATQNRPISSETSMLSDGEQEHGENDTDYDASDEDNMELMSESKGYKSILTIKMKKQQRFLNEDGDGIGRKPNAIPPLDDWASEADVQDFSTGQGGDHPHLSHQALTQDPQEREASSADSGTTQIKDKLKTKRMSEGLSASYRCPWALCYSTGAQRTRVLLWWLCGSAAASIMLCVSDCDDPKGVTLKPVDSASASQKLRVTSKTMSATQNRPISSETSMLSDGEQEHGENDTDYDASDEDNMEFRGFCAASLSPMGLPRDR